MVFVGYYGEGFFGFQVYIDWLCVVIGFFVLGIEIGVIVVVVVVYWYVDQVEQYLVIFDQGYVDGEFFVIGDEFFCVVQWVYQLLVLLVVVFVQWYFVIFFGKYWNVWCQCL